VSLNLKQRKPRLLENFNEGSKLFITSRIIVFSLLAFDFAFARTFYKKIKFSHHVHRTSNYTILKQGLSEATRFFVMSHPPSPRPV